MAIGTGKLLGFNLMRNFAYPYFARDITEFWKRWHMSLTTWFRDYIFLPVSFSLAGKAKDEKIFHMHADLFIYIVASSVTWLLTGLWHGANYTFIVWGLIHGSFLVVYQWQRKPRKKLFKKWGISNNSSIVVAIETLITLIIVLFAWIFFRADNIGHALSYIDGIFSMSLLSVPEFPYMKIGLLIFTLTVAFIIVEWFGKNEEYAIAGISARFPVAARWAVYYILVVITFFFAGAGQKFIYFQF